jgi:BirA family transcriptional regulator, biotin operon repressor / biotin---[acetyl-CoA-carboxylase] ligase
LNYKLFTNIINLESVDSTNSYIRRQATACDSAIRNGVVVVARRQTAGRGRKDRSWYSGRDMSLTFSFLIDLRQKKPTEITALTLAAGVATVEAMRKFGICCSVKWPNDVFVGNRKICGILSETIDVKGGLSAICGIGINVNMDNQTLKSIGAPASSIYAETAKKYQPSEVLHAVLEELDKWLTVWLYEPISMVTSIWMQYAYGLGKAVQVLAEGKVLEEGFFVGLGQKGQFMLRKYNGEIADIWAGDFLWDTV